MKILCISTAAITTPPADDGYGGMEREMAWLVSGLRELGNHVSLLAKTGSRSGTHFADDEKDFPAIARPIIDDYEVIIDFSHDKTVGRAWPDKPQINTYQVMTVGHRINPVFISKGQREHIGLEGPVIYYGIDQDKYPLYEGPRDEYLLYVGSLIIEKRPHWVAEMGRDLGVPVVIAGPKWQQEYWPTIDNMDRMDNVTVLDEIAGEEKLKYIQQAKALIHPVGGKNWVEAGAIIVLEALACGTPVLATPNGCLPEYIMPNINGFLCANVGEMKLAYSKLGRLNPLTCRLSIQNFNYLRMSLDYHNLAKEVVIEGRRW